MIILIAAMSHGRVIGKSGALPWGHGSMKHDQDRYRRLIKGRTIAIGSGTYDPADDYIRNAKHVYLLTTRNLPGSDKLTICHSIEPVVEAARTQEMFVVGGARVFEEFMPHADRLELTYIDAGYEGDRFFPRFDEDDWQLTDEESHEADKDNVHPYKFVTLVRKT